MVNETAYYAMDAVNDALRANGFQTHAGAADEPVIKTRIDTTQTAPLMYEVVEENSPTEFRITMTDKHRFQVYFIADDD